MWDIRWRWESKIRLGEEIFNEIIRNPIPIEMYTLKALKPKFPPFYT